MARCRKNTDEALLLALACGATVENAARSAGVSARTAHRRLKEAAFQMRLQDLRRDMVQRAADVLTAMTLDATKRLHGLQEESVPPSVRLAAIRTVLEYGMKLREQTDLSQRLAALEARMP
jgi:hypothetical protein